MNARYRKTERGELRHLVLHKRDERTDDERGAAARDARQLEAERFAGARRHDEKHIFPGDGGATDDFLIGTER